MSRYLNGGDGFGNRGWIGVRTWSKEDEEKSGDGECGSLGAGVGFSGRRPRGAERGAVGGEAWEFATGRLVEGKICHGHMVWCSRYV